MSRFLKKVTDPERTGPMSILIISDDIQRRFMMMKRRGEGRGTKWL